ncbi:MAG: hypothetical protein KJ968_03510 [Nanoarchaeota archaeon]|nr:hypothetical protein [Nanoarchaeota archaeon]
MESLEKILDAVISKVPLWVWPFIGYGAVLAYSKIKTLYKAMNAEGSKEDYSDKSIQRRIKELGGNITSRGDDKDYNHNKDDKDYK